MKTQRLLYRIVLLVLIFTTLTAWSSAPLLAASVGIMTKEELKEKLDSPDLVILDVRTGRDWTSSEFKIQGAVRANPREFDTWSNQHDTAKTLVLYCA